MREKGEIEMMNREELKGMEYKEIARELKKELRLNFKDVKFSVKTNTYTGGAAIYVTYEDRAINKDDVKEIAGMFQVRNACIYVNSEMAYYSDTKEYKDQQQKEIQAKQAEYARIGAEREKQYNEAVTIESIENYKVVNVENKDVFVIALEPAINKNNWKIDNDKYIMESSYSVKYKITDIVTLGEAEYNYFCFNLLNDYDFLTGRGGSWLDDETGELLYSYAVAIVCEGKETLIIDPQGHNYARYTCKLVTDINGDLEREISSNVVTDAEIKNKLNSIVDNELYNIGNVKKERILNDERYIHNDYFNAQTYVTGYAYKEMIFEGKYTEIGDFEGMKLHTNIDSFIQGLVKIETGQSFIMFDFGVDILKDVKFTERLKKELKRASQGFAPDDPDKKAKKESTIAAMNNVVNVDFSQRAVVTNSSNKNVINDSNIDKLNKEEPLATTKQMYALYCITKINNRGLKISKAYAGELISRANKGEDIKGIIQKLIDEQNRSIEAM